MFIEESNTFIIFSPCSINNIPYDNIYDVIQRYHNALKLFGVLFTKKRFSALKWYVGLSKFHFLNSQYFSSVLVHISLDTLYVWANSYPNSHQVDGP